MKILCYINYAIGLISLVASVLGLIVYTETSHDFCLFSFIIGIVIAWFCRIEDYMRHTVFYLKSLAERTSTK